MLTLQKTFEIDSRSDFESYYKNISQYCEVSDFDGASRNNKLDFIYHIEEFDIKCINTYKKFVIPKAEVRRTENKNIFNLKIRVNLIGLLISCIIFGYLIVQSFLVDFILFYIVISFLSCSLLYYNISYCIDRITLIQEILFDEQYVMKIKTLTKWKFLFLG